LTGFPEQIVFAVPEIESGLEDNVFTIIVSVLQIEFPQDVVCCLPQYIVVTVGAAIVRFFPVPILNPPQLPVYQPNELPVPAEPEITIVPPVFVHKLIPVVDTEAGAIGDTSIVTVLLIHAELPQPGICHLAKYIVDCAGAVIVFGLPDPTSVPPQLLLYHINVVPEPPVAVKVMFPPKLEQKLFLSVTAHNGATAETLILIVVLTQDVVLHGPSALTK